QKRKDEICPFSSLAFLQPTTVDKEPGLTGTKGVESYKYLKVQDKIVTTDEYAKAREKWLKEKEESNKKAQEELAKHVK
ncbi:hypothetical protein V2M20_10640, partial [Streptococcus pneumoniae]